MFSLDPRSSVGVELVIHEDAPLSNMTRASDFPFKTPFCALYDAYVVCNVINRMRRSPATVQIRPANVTAQGSVSFLLPKLATYG